tara:strand:+ start:1873 stop:2166 length:294 start_codon:yes stop_codon:yes gene_type:complete
MSFSKRAFENLEMEENMPNTFQVKITEHVLGIYGTYLGGKIRNNKLILQIRNVQDTEFGDNETVKQYELSSDTVDDLINALVDIHVDMEDKNGKESE